MNDSISLYTTVMTTQILEERYVVALGRLTSTLDRNQAELKADIDPKLSALKADIDPLKKELAQIKMLNLVLIVVVVLSLKVPDTIVQAGTCNSTNWRVEKNTFSNFAIHFIYRNWLVVRVLTSFFDFSNKTIVGWVEQSQPWKRLFPPLRLSVPSNKTTVGRKTLPSKKQHHNTTSGAYSRELGEGVSLFVVLPHSSLVQCSLARSEKWRDRD